MQKFLALAFVTILLPLIARAEMSSTNYHIYADSINTGGTLSTGGSYGIQDTVGETPSTGTSTGGSYQIDGGYQYMEKGYITLSLSSSTINLPSIRANAFSQASTTVTMDTDSVTGYSLSISNVVGSILTDVADGDVSAGSDEYGINTSGGDGVLSADTAVAPGLVLASIGTPIASARSTDLIFKAATSISASGLAYSQTITLSASANF